MGLFVCLFLVNLYIVMLVELSTEELVLIGGLAQLVERVLSMHEVSGSIPEFSSVYIFCLLVQTVWYL